MSASGRIPAAGVASAGFWGEIAIFRLAMPMARRLFMQALCLLCMAAPAAASQSAPNATSASPLVSGDSAVWCKRLTPRLPGVSNAMCQSSALVPTGAESLQKFPILARRIHAAAAIDSNKLPVRVMLLGGIHGDELTAASIVFKWLKFMPTEAAQRFDWMVVPVVNPDGLLAKKPNRVNANGVDLNRNFPTPGWSEEAPRYWADKTRSDPRRFPGKTPLSEPESKWLNDEMERFQPQVIISVHAPYGVLDFDGPAEPPRRFGRLLLNRVGVYPGSLGNYSGFHKNVPVITIELPNARAMPPEDEIERIWRDMLRWLQANVEPQEKPHAVAAAARSETENETSLTARARKVWNWFISLTQSQ